MAGVFGQTTGSFGSSSVFGNTFNSSQNLFIPKSPGATNFTSSATQGSFFGGSSSSAFGASQSSTPTSTTSFIFGNNSNSNHSSFVPSSSSSGNTTFPTFQTHGSVFLDSSTGVFGAPSISPAFSPSLFGQTSGSIGSSSVFGNNSNSNHSSFVPSSSGNTTFPTFQTHGSVFPDSSTGVFGAPLNSPAFSPSLFGQTSGSIGSSSVFGNNNNSNHNSIVPPSSGNTTFPTFQTHGSVFLDSSTGVLGAPSISPAFSPSLFGQTSGSIGSSSVFGNNNNSNHSSFFPSSSGNTTFPTFQTHGSVFLDSSTGVFGAPPISPDFSPSLFGQTSGSIGSSSVFGNNSNSNHSSFVPSSSGNTTFPTFQTHGSVFPDSSTGVFGAPSISPAFSPSRFGQTSGSLGSSSIFGVMCNENRNLFASNSAENSTLSIFGFGKASSTSTSNNGFAFKLSGSAPAFVSQTKGSSFHGATGSNVFASSSFAASTSVLAGIPGSSAQNAGTKIASYTPTFTKEGEKNCKLISISAMPTYVSKSHEELRWEDYKLCLGGQLNSRSRENGSIFNKQEPNFSFPSLKKPVTSTNPLFTTSTMSKNSIIPPFSGQTPLSNFQTLASNASDSAPILQQHPDEYFGSGWNSSEKPSAGFWPHLSPVTPNVPVAVTQFPSTTAGHNHFRVIYAAPQPAIAQVPSMITPLNQTIREQYAFPTPFSTVSCDIDQHGPPQLFFSTAKVANSVVAVEDPFGSKLAPSHSSISLQNGSSLIQHGISSMPVFDKSATVRVSSFLTARHTSVRPLTLHARKYRPKNDAPKVPFFDPIEETQSTQKALNVPIPRRNIRSLFCPSPELSHVAATKDEESPLNDNASSLLCENDKENPEADQFADIKPLTPKLQRSDYYTKPEIQELAIKEITEPGCCSQVKDFVVGRHGFGWVKFEGMTDVRGLDLDTLVYFNNREVIVYSEEGEKPPIGQGLNKAAEVTLLNIRCNSQKMVDKFTEKLRKVAQDQGAEFVSFDPINGQWKFRVKHF